MVVLKEAVFVDDTTITERSSSDGDPLVAWSSALSRPNQEIGWAIFDDDLTLSQIRILNLEYELDLRQLVSMLGDPDGYFVNEYWPPESSLRHYDVNFIWPEYGFSASVNYECRLDLASGAQVASADSQIAGVVYSSPADSALALEMGRGRSEQSVSEDMDCCYQVWEGADSVTMP